MFSDMNLKLVLIWRENGKKKEISSSYKIVDNVIPDHKLSSYIKLVHSFSHYNKTTERRSTEMYVSGHNIQVVRERKEKIF